MEFKHISVMLDECIEALNIKSDGVYMDGTLGGGGHSSEIASRLNKNGTLIIETYHYVGFQSGNQFRQISRYV